MGMDLRNVGTWRYFGCNWVVWRYLFQTGIDYGWQPVGTILDDFELELRDGVDKDGCHKRRKEEWGGDYFSNDWQVVTEEDAQNWRQALESAVNHPIFLNTEDTASVTYIKDFMDFLADGAFRIG